MNGTVSPEALVEALAALVNQGGLVLADEWLDVPEAAKAAGVSRSEIYEWMRDGLPFRDRGGRRIRRAVLFQFMRDMEVVMVRGKRVPSARAKSASQDDKRARLATSSAASKKARTAVAAKRANTARLGGGTDRASLEDLLDRSRKAA